LEKSKAKILNNAHDGMVLLLHPTSETNALILDDVITELKADGYSFGTLDELKQKCFQ
jgi:peptidoglycan-N-acetylmuramic acid deacetylase